MEGRTDSYLLTADQAAERYNISKRSIRTLYARNKDFPIIRLGHKVLIHRDEADAWFTRNIREVIETE